MGDSLGAGIVYHLSKNDLSNMTPMEDLNSVVDEPKKNGGNINEGLSTECNERLWTVMTLWHSSEWRAICSYEEKSSNHAEQSLCLQNYANII